MHRPRRRSETSDRRKSGYPKRGFNGARSGSEDRPGETEISATEASAVMYRIRSGSGGFGDVPQTSAAMPSTILGVPIADYCSDGLKWLTNYYCWSYSPAAWGQMSSFAGQASTLPLPVPPQAVTNYGVSETVPPTVEQAESATSAALKEAAAATQAQNLAAFQGFIPVLDLSGGGGGLGTLALVALGLGAAGVLLVLTAGRKRRR